MSQPDDLSIAYIGLGSNLGDRLGFFRAAVARLARSDRVAIVADGIASLYETAPVGTEGQPPFLNSAFCVCTSLSPADLLEALLQVESSLGRIRREPGESRVIDLDLLLYGGAVVSASGIAVPHPRLHERRFVLEPLAEIGATVVHPVLGRSIGQLAHEARANFCDQKIEKIGGPQWIPDGAADSVPAP